MKVTNRLKEKMECLRLEGYTIAEIAQECGVCKTTVDFHTGPESARVKKRNQWKLKQRKRYNDSRQQNLSP